jgi:hypothetical protein
MGTIIWRAEGKGQRAKGKERAEGTRATGRSAFATPREKVYTRGVRGDSVRDFYAKTLAVVGLGLIAGAGAVVDYWPVSRPLPAVDGRLSLLTAPPALPQNLSQDIPLPAPVLARATLTPARPVIRPQHIAWPAFAEPAAVLAAAGLTPGTKAARLPAIPNDRLPVITAPAVEIVSQIGEPVALVAYAVAPPVEDMRSSGSITPARSGQPGFLGGALKKTKDSIVRTGAATGASIADAFRGFFGAVKKVSPF